MSSDDHKTDGAHSDAESTAEASAASANTHEPTSGAATDTETGAEAQPSEETRPDSDQAARVATLISELHALRGMIARHGVEPIRANHREQRLEVQISRLETRQIELDRRRLSERRSEVERVELEHRARKLEEKLNRLTETLEKVRISGNSEAWNANLFGRFSDTVRELLRAEHNGALQLEGDDRELLRGWLTFTVRRRRAALTDVAERVEQARKYVLQAIARARSERGVEAALRSRAMLIMAQNAQRDAQLELQRLAHVWDDLAELAHDSRWFDLAWRETQNAAVRVAQGAQSTAAEELLKTLAGRLEERKSAVLNAPHPGEATAS